MNTERPLALPQSTHEHIAGAHKEEGTRPGHMHLVISLIKWNFITLALSSFLSSLLTLSLFPGLGSELPSYLKREFIKAKYWVTIPHVTVYALS